MVKIQVEIKLAYNDTDNIRKLFAEYTKMLLDVCNDFQQYLDIQGYDHEIEDTNEKYSLPNGRLYIAYCDNQAAGCIALRQISKTECEMKRLYIKQQYRGHQIGRTLVETIINDAKEIGYQFMLLDTLPELKTAIALYDGIGFHRVPQYNNSPIEKTLFMKLDLCTE